MEFDRFVAVGDGVIVLVLIYQFPGTVGIRDGGGRRGGSRLRF